MFNLDAKTVARAILDNWDRLGCNTGKTDCRYFYCDGTVCAIGAALPPEMEALINAASLTGSSLDRLIDEGFICVPEHDLDALVSLQELHDEATIDPLSRPKLRSLARRIVDKRE